MNTGGWCRSQTAELAKGLTQVWLCDFWLCSNFNLAVQFIYFTWQTSSVTPGTWCASQSDFDPIELPGYTIFTNSLLIVLNFQREACILCHNDKLDFHPDKLVVITGLPSLCQIQTTQTSLLEMLRFQQICPQLQD